MKNGGADLHILSGGNSRRPKAINQDAVAMVERLLEEVRSGTTTAVAYVGVSESNEVGHAYSQDGQWHELRSGALSLLARLS
jgi:hypothetical protein